MTTYGTKVLAIAAAASIALTGCGSNDQAPDDGPTARAARGGTLTYYLPAALVDHLDPQRTYNGVVLTSLGRTVYRQLVTFDTSTDAEKGTTPVADLATDSGTSEDGARTWTFTVRDGVTWEDGEPVTCEDFKYGASRVFATDVITGVPGYLLTYLDIPTDPKTDLPIYTGPYQSSAEGKAAFDKAVICDGKTITYHFKKPWADFPLAIAALHMMDPYRADKDQRERSDFQIFSNGPYRLEGAWDADKGGTLVRNDNYDPKTDSTDIRKALPDKIVLVVDKTDEQATELLIADHGRDRAAVTAELIPVSAYGDITGDIADRAVKVEGPYTDYLMLNFRRLTNLKVRQALAASTDVTAWIAAGGGEKRLHEATDIVHPAVKGYQEDLFPGGSGDPEKARQLLESAGVQTPYPISYTYPSTFATDEQAAALRDGWERAGFDVTVDVVANVKKYYTILGTPGQKADVMWGGWGADWPSAMTVTAPQFDSRPNLTESSNGNDFGAYKSTQFEALVDEAQEATDLDQQTTLLQQADQVLAKDVAYIPLDTGVFYFLHGSDVTGYVNTAGSNWYPDLGSIGVK